MHQVVTKTLPNDTPNVHATSIAQLGKQAKQTGQGLAYKAVLILMPRTAMWAGMSEIM